MSINVLLGRAISSGDLSYLEMQDASDPIERVMLIGSEILALLNAPFSDRGHERRIGALRADLESFVKGDVISMSFSPREHKAAYMGLLEPVGAATWEIRSRDPSPGLRIFGRFARRDVFLALGWAPRSQQAAWSKKMPLGEKELNWRIQISDCDEKWNRILPGAVPVPPSKVTEHVSEKYHIV